MKSKHIKQEEEINEFKIEKNDNLLSETEKRVERDRKNGNSDYLQERKKESEMEKEKEKVKYDYDKNDDSVWNLEGPEFDPMAVLGLTLKIQKVNN